MARKSFLWYLFSVNKKPYYISDTGFVVEGDENWFKADGQPAHLEFSPTGWPDVLVKYARNTTYWGLQRDMTVPMVFPKDGFKILKYLYKLYGYEAICYLGAVKLNRLLLPYKYESWYLSELNFVKSKGNDVSFQVEALEGGMSKIFKAFENQVYEIELGLEKKTVLMDGVLLTGKQNYIIGNFYFDPYLGNGYFVFHPLMVMDTVEGVSTGIEMQESNYTPLDFGDIPLSMNWFIMAENGNAAPVTVNIKGTFRLKLVILRDNVLFRFRLFKYDGTYTYYDVYNPSTGAPLFTVEGQIIDIAFDIDIPLDAGDRVFGIMEIGQGTNTGRPCAWEIQEGSTFAVKFQNKYRESYADGLYLYDVLRKVVEKMTEGAVLLPTNDGVFYKSDWLKNKRDIIVLSQDNIRGIADGKIKTSIKQLFTSCRHWSATLGIENDHLFIELFDYVFKDDILIDLEEVDKAYYGTAEDLLFNSIKTGGKVEEYNDVNGRYEFNQEQTWQCPVTKVTKELDLTTGYRRDCYGAEFARINLEGKTTTDNKSDNDVFMLNVENAVQIDPVSGLQYQKLNRPVYDSITGVDGTVFNTELTPKLTLLNNGMFIHSVMDTPLDARDIIQTSAEKNKDLKTVLGARVVEEKAPITIASLPVSKFSPNYIYFETKVPVNLLTIMKANSYGKIKFTVRGRVYYGWLFDGGIKPAMNDKQSWKLLSSSENDLSKFYEPL